VAYKQGATPDDFHKLLHSTSSWTESLVQAVGMPDAGDKADAVGSAVLVAALLPAAHADAMVTQVKRAAKGVIAAKTVADMLEKAQKAHGPANGNGGNGSGAKPDASVGSDPAAMPYYYVRDGDDLVRARRQSAVHSAWRRGGVYAGGSLWMMGRPPKTNWCCKSHWQVGGRTRCGFRLKNQGSRGRSARLSSGVMGPFVTIEAKMGPYSHTGYRGADR
jgi:hypothetical protein